MTNDIVSDIVSDPVQPIVGGLSGLLLGLLHWWDLNDDGVWGDSVGSWSLSESGTVTISSGTAPDSGDCALGDGTSYLLKNGVKAPTTNKLTLSGWFKASGSPIAYDMCATLRHPTNGSVAAINHQSPQGTGVQGRTWGATGTQSAASHVADIPDGVWRNLVITDDGTTRRFYVNTTEVDTDTTSIGAYDTDDMNFLLLANASSPLASTTMAGNVCMVGLWDRAITSDEVDSLYNSGSGTRYANL